MKLKECLKGYSKLDKSIIIIVGPTAVGKTKYSIEVAKAFIVLKQGVKQNEAIINSIKKLCVTNLAKFSIPYEFEFRDSLPKTLVGKVAYKKLEEEEAKKRNNNN